MQERQLKMLRRMTRQVNSILSEGMTLELAGVDLKEGKTRARLRDFTGDLLLSAMESASSDESPAGVERKGIGTIAPTRAIIENWCSR